MIRRLLLAVPLAVLIGLLVAPAASAHVRVSGTDVTQGGYGVLTFRVPTESATASTVGLTVTLPKDTPLTSVSVLPITGWTAKQQTKKLDKPLGTADGTIDSYVASVTWTADSPSYALKPGEFGEFTISAGPLPKTSELILPATQRYSNGTTVAWDEIAQDKGAEPAHPAPTLELTPAASSSASAPTSTTAPSAAPANQAAGTTTTSASWLSPAMILAAVAVVLAMIALVRTTRPTGNPADAQPGKHSDDQPGESDDQSGDQDDPQPSR